MEQRKRIYSGIQIAIILVFCALTILFDFIEIQWLKDEWRNRLLAKILQQFFGGIAGLFLLMRLNIQILAKPTNLLYLIPGFAVAINNFQFSAYFNGEIELIRGGVIDFLLFGVYCVLTGLFEEFIFRGVIFALLIGMFPRNKKGLIWTVILSSIIFGLVHLVNGFSFQIIYTMLTGALFAFCFIKTKSLFCCAAVHAVYNFGGVLFDSGDNFGLGSGIVFDAGTVVSMLVIGILVSIFVVYKTFSYKKEECVALYKILNVNE